MGIGDMIGGLMGSDSPLDGLISKLGDAGVDASALQGLDVESITSMLAENGIDLSMLIGLGISTDDIISKITGS